MAYSYIEAKHNSKERSETPWGPWRWEQMNDREGGLSNGVMRDFDRVLQVLNLRLIYAQNEHTVTEEICRVQMGVWMVRLFRK